jgi:23S rRNA (cytosine1962-C5)-methyltransferase
VVTWARDNQRLSNMEARPIRWIVDDALKYVRREVKRGVRYDGLVIDPPKFGRGPEGEVWKLHETLPLLLSECAALLSDKPLFVVLSSYAVRTSSISLAHLLQALCPAGQIEAGEMGVAEAHGRHLAVANYARWSAD